MSKVCEFCGKHAVAGRSISHSHRVVNRTFKPTIDNTKCLETAQGKKCGACGRACDEGIDPRHPELSEAAWSEFTKCRSCMDACPAHAISMPLIAKKDEPVSLKGNDE